MIRRLSSPHAPDEGQEAGVGVSSRSGLLQAFQRLEDFPLRILGQGVNIGYIIIKLVLSYLHQASLDSAGTLRNHY